MEVFQMMWNVAFSLKQKITQWRSPDWSCMILSQSLMMVDHHQLLKESSSSFPQRTVRHTKYMCEWIKKQLLFGFFLNTPKNTQLLCCCEVPQLYTLRVTQYIYNIYTQSYTDEYILLGGSGEVVNSLDFCLALLKSLGCFYFQCVLSSQWKAVTVNLRILHCQL